MYWNEKIECCTDSKKEKLLSERLQNSIRRAYEKVPYYQKMFDKHKVKPSDIKTIKDISKLPFITKDDLRKAYPFGLFAVPQSEIVEIHTSSGTTGIPVVAGYTRGDLKIWSESIARALTMAGVSKDDIIQNAYGYGLFTGGLGLHYGAQEVGATVIPISAGNTKRQLELMRDFGTTVLTCTPSYALYMAETAEEMGINPKKLKLRVGIHGAEMWTERMRQEIEKRLDISAHDIYGLTEIIGPGVGMECEEKCGLHIMEDHFYPEIISPDTLEPLPDGEKGELVLTTLTREGIPMIRFRTKDLTSIHREKCSCGRTLAKIERISGRSDDMMKIRGVIVFPSQIEKALLEGTGLEPQYQIIISRPHQLDELEVRVEASKKLFSDEVRRIEEVRTKLEVKIEKTIGLRVKVTLVEPKSLPRSEGKAKRVIDTRNL